MASPLRKCRTNPRQHAPGAGSFAGLQTGSKISAGGAILLVAVVVSIVVAVPAETPAQGDKAPAKTEATAKPEYGDQGGEKVMPATSRLPNAVMRARKEDTFLKLSNPRLGTVSGATGKGGKGGKGAKGLIGAKALLVDYEVVSKGKFEGGSIVLRASDGSKAEVALTSLTGRDEGTIQLVGAQRFRGSKASRDVMVPEDLEMYIVRGDDRYDPPSKYMVSNAVVMGKMKTSTRPRDWTAAEIARYGKSPPAYKNPNAFPDVGEDVPPLEGSPGPRFHRYVDPEGMLLGLDYSVGDWDKRKTIGRLAPVYTIDQPKQNTARSVARKGYAVAGAELNEDKYVLGIRLLFCRVKADGTLDMKDAYSGPWMGTPAGGKAVTLVNDGRRVLGIHFKTGAIVDRFALVAENKTK
jgi:hypothetical protein